VKRAECRNGSDIESYLKIIEVLGKTPPTYLRDSTNTTSTPIMETS
jgi:hypothetical protein